MPTGRERAFGINYVPIRQHRPAAMFHGTGNKNTALERMKPNVAIPEYILLTPKRKAIDFGWMCADEDISAYTFSSNIDELIDGLNSIIIGNTKFTHAIEKAMIVQSDIRSAKKKRSVKQINMFTIIKPAAIQRPGSSSAKCQAITMSNKQCKFKAVCGNFCNKHKIII